MASSATAVGFRAYRLNALAEYLGARCLGDPELLITGIGSLQEALPGHISFVAKSQYADQIEGCGASALIVAPALEHKISHGLVVEDPYLAYAKLTRLFETCPQVPVGVHTTAVIDPAASLGRNVAIGPFCVVEAGVVLGDDVQLFAGVTVGARSQIGAGSVLFSHVVIYHDVLIGKQVRIHANTTIGSDGFGFAPSAQGWQKIHQIGGVVIGDNVEIGSNTSIDRGALSDTRIADGVIIDNQVHIAHNVHVGKNTAIAGCVGIAGSAKIGANCTMGGFVAISGHVEIADNVHFNGASIVTKSISQAGHYSSGVPLQEVRDWRRNAVRFSQLDSWVERIKQLENKKSDD
jgi:UDP-3-O-[3-hydroxymyristoyl] glucosamine N-acyltransferase